jgi:hypothetical protein
MPVTIEDIMNKLHAMTIQINEIHGALIINHPFVVTPVWSISEESKGEIDAGFIPPNITPSVPPEFQVGKNVYLAHDPEKRQVPITQIGDGIVRISIPEELKAFLNIPDHGGWFYPSSLILVN